VVRDAIKLVSEFSQLGQVLSAAPDENARLKLAVDAAVSLVAHCDHAGITINQKRGPVTRVSSDDVVTRANELQYELGEGPCLDVLRDQETLVSPDLTQERRWPLWSQRAHQDLGVGSMMSLLIYTDEHSYGALSMYAKGGIRFDVDDLAVGQALAGQISVIMSAEREIDQLESALHDRVVIGQAQGILMERLGISAAQAFDFLRRTSMESNRKLVFVAREIAETGKLPVAR
jgi:GAF domain-containing protein